VSKAMIGLYYKSAYKGAKLITQIPQDVGVTGTKKIQLLGLLLNNTHYQGIKYGSDFERMYDLPQVEDGRLTPEDTVWEHFDKDSMEFDGVWDPDQRVCLQAEAPKPCTVLGLMVHMNQSNK
jgi:hypothetical protein